MRLSFRPDVDYLRAIAVVAVIGFHFGIPGVYGGFVGVDIFFVISGYLISRLIWAGLLAGEFSFRAFYERRARRLLPALYVTIAVTGVAAWFVARPNDYVMFFESAIATVLLGSNIYFWHQVGYFDLPSVGKVLIHTWSLSVEEQFYFVFPILIWIWNKVFRSPSSPSSFALIAIGTIVLFALDQHLLDNGRAADAFYLSPFRAWEFLIGVLVYLADPWSPSDIRIRRGFAIVGAALILLPVIMYRADTSFPGLHALIPCLGTAIFMMAYSREGGPALPCRSAGLYIGKISYSLYLWHWPVLILGTAALPLRWEGTPTTTVSLMLLTAALAIASYNLIEAPARAVSWRGLGVPTAIAAGAVLLVAIGSLGITAQGYPQRFAQAQLRLLRYNRQVVSPYYRERSCFLQLEDDFAKYDKIGCMTFAPDKTNVVLYGDSLAAHYAGSIRLYLDPRRFNLIQLNSGGCQPFVGSDQPAVPSCNAVNAAFAGLLDRADVVILSGNWRYYMNPLHKSQQEPEDLAVFDTKLGATLSAIEAHGVPVLLLGPSLEFSAPLAPSVARYELNHVASDKPWPRSDSFAGDEHLRAFAKSYPNVRYASVLDALCHGADCLLLANDDTPVVWDTIHLTPEGSQLVLRRLAPVLDEVLAAGQSRSSSGRVEAQVGRPDVVRGTP